MPGTDDKTETQAQTWMAHLTQPVTVTLPGYAFAAAAVAVLALIVVAID